MIKDELTPEDIGRRVIYVPTGDIHGKRAEEGIVTSFNHRYVFVRFGGSSNGVAVHRMNLRWAE